MADYDSGALWDSGLFYDEPLYRAPASPSKTDIAIIWSNTRAPAGGDWKMQGADLLRGGDLGTAILFSLFSDAQARADDTIPDGTDDRRGWWGEPSLGSRLWLLDRSKLTQAVALKAENYASDAVQWLIEDGAVAAIDIVSTIKAPETLWLTVTAYRTAADKIAKKYAWAWSGVLFSQE